MLYAKKIIVVLIAFFSLQVLSAQSNYVTHTLKQGESLSMLAQQYNTSVGDIMRMNNMHANTKLVYGSKIKIPSSKSKTEAVKKSSTTIINTPAKTSGNEITHVVMKGETLYSISKKYSISVEQIKAWNHLADNNAKVGTL
ncbi:MAG TPA: LysM peptidoglycan-binding domain-containing protein, partial [Parafilimonas sp.]